MNKLLAACAAGLCVLGTTTVLHAETLLRLSLQFPIEHPVGQNLVRFAEDVAEGTNGSVKIEIYPSAQLFKDNEVPQAVGSGAIEMGSASLTRLVGDAPVVDALYVPFLFDSPSKVRSALDPGAEIREILDSEIAKSGSIVLYYQAIGSAIILTRGDTPIVVPEDMEGKLVRSFGATISNMIEAVGGAPTIISGSEQFLAFQTGTVDAGMTGITTVPSRKLYEVTDHVTMTNHAALEFVVLINTAVWDGLTDEERTVIREAAVKAEASQRDFMEKHEVDAKEQIRDKINVVELSDEQRDAWREATKSVADAYIERAGNAGQLVVEKARALP
jgi:C4-dicarboxylate-binding protein DctP